VGRRHAGLRQDAGKAQGSPSPGTLGAATVALGQVFLLGPPYAVVAGLADDGSRAGYLAAYGTCWGIAQTLGPLASTRLMSIGVPATWLTDAALCVLLAALVPFAARAVTMADRRPALTRHFASGCYRDAGSGSSA
jgi:hypothetical protein